MRFRSPCALGAAGARVEITTPVSPRKEPPMTHKMITRTGAAGAAAAIAALSLALPANAQRHPEPEPNTGPAPSIVVGAPTSVPDGGLQIIQVGAGLLAGIGIGAA